MPKEVMVITFHALMLRSEKNNAEQTALGLTKKKIQSKSTVKQTDFINKTKFFTADFYHFVGKGV